jgi:CRISPR-associated protein Cmr1
MGVAVGTSSFPALPAPRPRRTTRGGELREIAVSLVTTTPILGGATTTRNVDEVDVIRAPSIRGQLRFWWRAVHGHGCGAPEDLAAREAEIWGGIPREGSDEGRRSAVEVRVSDVRGAAKDGSDVSFGHPAAYALWPARETRGKNATPAAPRYQAGLRFTLTLRVERGHEDQVQRALRAWILFGGYGGRARRGCGSLTVVGEEQSGVWLPRAATAEGLRALMGPAKGEPGDLPLLRGAALCVGEAARTGEAAWHVALGWLKDFRQAQPPSPRADLAASFARVRGDGRRPGRSNWPEADKVRILEQQWPPEHEPRHDEDPAWPRASFGLPILGRFQSKSRDGGEYRPPEPRGFELGWTRPGETDLHDRLASPLILKAMPLATGLFVPVALWLFRAYPKDGRVVLVKGEGKSKRAAPDSAAPFDRLVSPGDREGGRVYYAPLRERDMRDAFLHWLVDPRGQRRVRKV